MTGTAGITDKVVILLTVIKTALAEHSPETADEAELALYRWVLTSIALGEDSVHHARVAFLVRRMRTAQAIADMEAAKKAEAEAKAKSKKEQEEKEETS